MALVLADRVRQTGTANTTVSFTLSGSVTGFQSFAVIGNTNTTYYSATDGAGNWEVGIGTYSTTGPTLTRTTILSSSNSGSAETFSGTVTVFVTYPSSKSVEYEQTGGVVITDAGTNDALRITQTGTGNALVIEDSANPDSTPFVIDATGNVITGYTATLATQNYGGSLVTPKIQLQGTGQDTASIASFNWGTSLGSPANLILSKSIGGAIGTRGALTAANTDIGSISFNGDDGTNFIPAAAILVETGGTPGANDMPGRLIFSTTADGAATPTERMRIDSVGRVGIGTGTTTGYQLRLAGSYADPSATVIITGINGTLPSTNTSNAYGVFSGLSTTAASYTLSKLHHFFASQGTIGAGSAITDQYGFHANSNITGATNNYGFYSNIASGTGRWNFYAAGTADNYFAGNVQFAAGTAAAPAITTSGDTNTGIFFPAADTIAFAEGGAEVMRLDSSANLQFNSGYGSVATAYGCRAWVNFNGTGTVAIRASGNVSSITDGGTGNYTINFTNAMPDVDYATVGSVWNTVDNGSTTQYSTARVAGIDIKGASGISTGSVAVITKATATEASAGNVVDFSGVFVSVFR